MIDFLPTWNACCNGVSAILLCLGYLAIRRSKRTLHARLMVSALGSSTLFLAGYLTRMFLTGPTHYQGPAQGLYWAILGTHTLLAASLVVLVPLTVVRAARGRFDAHKRIARITLPIWMYVSVTGVVIYLFLYT